MRIERTRLLASLTILVLASAASPVAAFACERCFGAGADSPIVSAIGVSMLSLLVLVGFVFTGLVKFFADAHNRSRELEALRQTEDRGAVTPTPSSQSDSNRS